MKKIKLILASVLFVCSTSVFAEGVDIVTLTTMAEGKTQDEAVTNALRSALEQAFGTFISSQTDIVDDELIRDEIVSVSSGNIQKYDVLSSTNLLNGNTAVVVKANVSVTKLTTFSYSKGIEVKFKGALFAANIKLQQLYAKNELEALKHLQTIITEMLLSQNCYDYAIEVYDPIASRYGWKLRHIITITPNNNFYNLHTIIRNTLNSLSMSDREKKDYDLRNLYYHEVSYFSDKGQGRRENYYLRNGNSAEILCTIHNNISNVRYRCQINNGVYTKTLYSRFFKDQDCWYVGLLTNYIPTYSAIYGLHTENFDWEQYESRTFKNLDNIDLEEDENYPKYDSHKTTLSPLIKITSCDNPGNDILGPRNEKKMLLYIDILPLSVLEKIQKYTIEPYRYEE
jgi:hypothetical protein